MPKRKNIINKTFKIYKFNLYQQIAKSLPNLIDIIIKLPLFKLNQGKCRHNEKLPTMYLLL